MICETSDLSRFDLRTFFSKSSKIFSKPPMNMIFSSEHPFRLVLEPCKKSLPYDHSLIIYSEKHGPPFLQKWGGRSFIAALVEKFEELNTSVRETETVINSLNKDAFNSSSLSSVNCSPVFLHMRLLSELVHITLVRLNLQMKQLCDEEHYFGVKILLNIMFMYTR